MKGMIKFLAIACIAFALGSCGSDSKVDPNPPQPPVEGDGIYGYWKLTSWSDSEFEKDVYLQIVKEPATFVLYQNLVSAGFTKYEGVYVYNESTKAISGTYSDDVPWGFSYTVSGDLKTTMVWTATDNAKDVSTYTRISEIPSDVINGTRAASVGADTGERFL